MLGCFVEVVSGQGFDDFLEDRTFSPLGMTDTGFQAPPDKLDGARLLGRKTAASMTRNHPPGDMTSMGQPRFTEYRLDSVGFGLGFAVMLDPARAQVMTSPGE